LGSFFNQSSCCGRFRTEFFRKLSYFANIPHPKFSRFRIPMCTNIVCHCRKQTHWGTTTKLNRRRKKNGLSFGVEKLSPELLIDNIISSSRLWPPCFTSNVEVIP
jgi:hypothetical protein